MSERHRGDRCLVRSEPSPYRHPMPRRDSASRVIPATPEDVFAALADEEARVVWLPPKWMTGRFEQFDPRPGADIASFSPMTTTAAKGSQEATPTW